MMTLEHLYKQYGDNAFLMLCWCTSNFLLDLKYYDSLQHPVLFISGNDQKKTDKAAIACHSFYEKFELYDLDRAVLKKTGLTLSNFNKYGNEHYNIPLILREYQDNKTINSIITKAFSRSACGKTSQKHDGIRESYSVNCGLIVTGEVRPGNLHEYWRCNFVDLSDLTKKYSGKFDQYGNDISDLAGIIQQRINKQKCNDLLAKALENIKSFDNRLVQLDPTYSLLMAGYLILTKLELIPNCLDINFWSKLVDIDLHPKEIGLQAKAR